MRLNAQIHIIKVLETGTAFAETAEGEGVIIPAAVARAALLNLGDQVQARLCANHHDRSGSIPFKCIGIQGVEPLATLPTLDGDSVQPPSLDDILDLASNGEAWTLPDLIAELEIDYGALTPRQMAYVSNALDVMASRGALKRAAIYAAPDLSTPIGVAYADRMDSITQGIVDRLNNGVDNGRDCP